MNDDEKASTNLAGVADNKHKFTGQTCQAVLRMAYCISHISLLISSSPHIVLQPHLLHCRDYNRIRFGYRQGNLFLILYIINQLPAKHLFQIRI